MSNTAVIFPGQGSQSVGMLGSLAEAYPVVRTTFDEASDALGSDLWKLAADGPAERLDQTEWTQPVMLAADVAVWRAYRGAGGAMPVAMAGHSLGEYAALVAAGSLDLADAVRAVHERGRLMQAAVPEGTGAMAAVLGLDDEKIAEVCEATAQGAVVVPANFNAPGQIVIAGEREAVQRAADACRRAGARRAMLLAVSVPAHSPLMQPAEAGLRKALESSQIRVADCAVLHNVGLAPRFEVADIVEALVLQLTHPVRWTGTIRELSKLGATRFLECGPGRVLSGLGRRIQREAEWLALEASETLAQAARTA
jgi:[acyl-carrier-protein] S-malonyltransferase